jgi:chromosome segregation ATPase
VNFDIERTPVSNSLEEKYNDLQQEYDKLIKNQYDKDYRLENLKKALENVNKTLERYETENRALRDLLRLWM